jgi:hypothetical protein
MQSPPNLYDQRKAALDRSELWWRFPAESGGWMWSKPHDDFNPVLPQDLMNTKAEYFIGPVPPVLNESEHFKPRHLCAA